MRKLAFFAALLAGTMVAKAEDITVNDIVYTINSDGTTVSVGNNTACTLEDVVLPASINYDSKDYNVTNVSSSAFDDNKTIKTLTVAVPVIGPTAFRGCTNLSSVTLQEGVKSLGLAAFETTALTAVHIPASVNSISTSNDQPFVKCQNITAFTVAEGNTAYCAVDGVLYNKSVTRLIAFPLAKKFNGFPGTVTEIGTAAFECYNGFDTLTIPAHITGKCSGAFKKSSVKTLIAENTQFNNSFQNCSKLETIVLGKDFTTIGELTFKGCTALTKITCMNETMPVMQQKNTSSWPCFGGVDMSSVKVYVPCGKSSDYTADTDKWADFTNITETLFYDLKVSADENGTAEVTTTPDCSTDAVITATANSGYKFKQWSDGNTENPRTLTVVQYATIALTAEFEAVTAVNEADNSSLRVINNVIENPENSTVKVYNILGQPVIVSQASSIDLNTLGSGVYIVNCGSETIKVVIG